MSPRDPLDRLSSAFRVTVGSETRERHLSEISAELKTMPVPAMRSPFRARRRVAAVAAGLMVLAPAALAVAADDAVPGDALYGVKQATERVVGLFDDRVAATHRVEEVERLVIRRAPARDISHAVRRAESATAALDDPGDLEARLIQAREQLRIQDEGGQSQHAEDAPGNGPDEGTRAGEGAGGSSTPSSDDPAKRQGDEPGATTTTAGGSNGRGGEGESGAMPDLSGSTTEPGPAHSP